MDNSNEQYLIELIDKLAPLNNDFRVLKEPMVKIEIMWEMGKVIDYFMTKNNLKLHELLYKLYDPYSTDKTSNITRDVGSYSHRVYRYFKKKSDISEYFKGLDSYTLFREAVPLLLNDKYGLSENDKKNILKLITSNTEVSSLIIKLREIKKGIRGISNPRDQKSQEYMKESIYLKDYSTRLLNFYKENETLSDMGEINKKFGLLESRKYLVSILMALASETFLGKINKIEESRVSDEIEDLLRIVNSGSQNRARFRKWVMSSNKLFNTAEAIHSLENNDDYSNYRSKIINV